MEDVAWATVVAGLAGFVRYIQRFAAPAAERPAWEVGPLLVAVFTGAFVGVLVIWIVPPATAAGHSRFAVAVAGYGGPLVMDFLVLALKDTLRRWIGNGDEKGR